MPERTGAFDSQNTKTPDTAAQEREAARLALLKPYVELLAHERTNISRGIASDLRRLINSGSLDVEAVRAIETDSEISYSSEYGLIVLDLEKRVVVSPLVPNRKVKLTAKEIQLLFAMLREPDGVLPSGNDSSSPTYIQRLRSKLDPDNIGLIQTSIGNGHFIPYNYTPEEIDIYNPQAEPKKGNFIPFTSESNDQLLLNKKRRQITSTLEKVKKPSNLTPEEFQVLLLLMENPTEAFTNRYLAEEFALTSVVAAGEVIRTIRHKIGDFGERDETAFRHRRHTFIHSTPFGYSLTPRG